MDIQSVVKNWALEAMEDSDIFLLDIIFSAAKNHFKIIIDADLGVTADKCSKVNRYINHQLEEMDPEHEYSIEVTSPGADKPLTMLRQYPKHIGRKLKITLQDGQIMEGRLQSVQSDTLTIEIGARKKEQRALPANQIKESIIQLSF